MLPVILADIDNDGQDDVTCVTHDGMLLALSGVDLTFLWRPLNFSMDGSTESYTYRFRYYP